MTPEWMKVYAGTQSIETSPLLTKAFDSQAMNTGIYEMDLDAYVRDPCPQPSLSSGIAHTLLTRSPLHAWTDHPKLNPQWRQSENSKFDIGSAAHAVLLEGAKDRIAVIAADDRRTKAAKEQRDLARMQGKIPLLSKEASAVWAMVKAAQVYCATSEIGDIFATGKPEQTIIWQADSDAWCRCRPDWIAANGAVLSYKTTANAEPEQWINYVALRSGYQIQAAFELLGLWEIEPDLSRPYYWLVQEIKPPYACMLAGMTPALRDHATEQVDHAIEIWRKCIGKNEWPAYGPRVHYAEPNNWQVAQWQERMSLEAMEAEGVIPVQAR